MKAWVRTDRVAKPPYTRPTELLFALRCIGWGVAVDSRLPPGAGFAGVRKAHPIAARLDGYRMSKADLHSDLQLSWHAAWRSAAHCQRLHPIRNANMATPYAPESATRTCSAQRLTLGPLACLACRLALSPLSCGCLRFCCALPGPALGPCDVGQHCIVAL